MAQIVRENLLSKIHKSGYFALILDETQDISPHEQVAVIIRIVDAELCVQDSWIFLRFLN